MGVSEVVGADNAETQDLLNENQGPCQVGSTCKKRGHCAPTIKFQPQEMARGHLHRMWEAEAGIRMCEERKGFTWGRDSQSGTLELKRNWGTLVQR